MLLDGVQRTRRGQATVEREADRQRISVRGDTARAKLIEAAGAIAMKMRDERFRNRRQIARGPRIEDASRIAAIPAGIDQQRRLAVADDRAVGRIIADAGQKRLSSCESTRAASSGRARACRQCVACAALRFPTQPDRRSAMRRARAALWRSPLHPSRREKRSGYTLPEFWSSRQWDLRSLPNALGASPCSPSGHAGACKNFVYDCRHTATGCHEAEAHRCANAARKSPFGGPSRCRRTSSIGASCKKLEGIFFSRRRLPV